jgi:hypothetical protein
MEVSSELKLMYGDYYLDEKVLMKRRISAQQSVDHITKVLPHYHYRSVIDIGAGDGSVLEELDKTNISNELYAVEISESGVTCIQGKKINKLRSVSQFDGYIIPPPPLHLNEVNYELGLAIHVLEHVEHERAFLYEISKICDYLYIEVPLELNINLNRNIESGVKYGHINYYNPATFRNLLESCNLEILNFKILTASLEYEKFLNGSMAGLLKSTFRGCVLNLLPNMAPSLLTYMAGAYCRKLN